MRVIADHARATAFLIADQVSPSNEWRGYVLRRIMRRAMRHGRLLGLTEPFLWQVTGVVAELMGGVYPELVEQRSRVAELTRLEEERFAETLDRGLERIAAEAQGAESWPRTAPGAAPRPRQGALHPLRHLRLPGRPRPGGAPGARLRGDARDPGRVRAGDGGAARARSRERDLRGRRRRRRTRRARRSTRRSSADIPKAEFLGYEAMTAPARILAMVADGRRRREAVAGRRGRGDPRPHAVLRRVRRPDRRHGRHHRPAGARRGRRHAVPRRRA